MRKIITFLNWKVSVSSPFDEGIKNILIVILFIIVENLDRIHVYFKDDLFYHCIISIHFMSKIIDFGRILSRSENSEYLLEHQQFTEVRRLSGPQEAWWRGRGWVVEWGDGNRRVGIRTHRPPSSHWSWSEYLHRGKRRIPWKRYRIPSRSVSGLHFLPLWFRSRPRN